MTRTRKTTNVEVSLTPIQAAALMKAAEVILGLEGPDGEEPPAGLTTEERAALGLAWGKLEFTTRG